MFNEGKENVHDEEWSRYPPLISEKLKDKPDQHIRKNSLFIHDKIHVTGSDDWQQISVLQEYLVRNYVANPLNQSLTVCYFSSS